METVTGWKKKLFFSSLMLAILTSVSLLASTVSASNASLQCEGSIGECNDEGELSMESEISRRVLAGLRAQNFITYPALGRQACNNKAGMPYTQGNGCVSGAVNPSSRGCQMIHQCRGS